MRKVLGNAHFTVVASQDQVFPNHNDLILTWHPSGNVIVMGDAAMPIQSKRSIITNRQLNFTLSPVDMYNPKQKQMPYKLPEYEINGTWNQHQSIILDVIFDYMIKKRYSKFSNFPKSWRSKKVIENDKAFYGTLFTISAIECLLTDPLYAYLKDGNEKILRREKEYYEGYDESERYPTFEEHLKNYLKNVTNYQIFLDKYEHTTSLMHEDYKVIFHFDDLFKKYQILSNYKYNIIEHLNKIAKTLFKMNYKVKSIEVDPSFDDTGRQNTKGVFASSIYCMREFESLFCIETVDDGFVLNFNSPLGKMVIHNTLVLDADWISEEVFTLSKNAYFIYKKFILNRFAAKNKVQDIVLWYEDIRSFLDLNWKNNSGNYGVIKKAFDEMQEKGLIQRYDWNRNYAKQRQYRITRPLEA